MASVICQIFIEMQKAILLAEGTLLVHLLKEILMYVLWLTIIGKKNFFLTIITDLVVT